MAQSQRHLRNVDEDFGELGWLVTKYDAFNRSVLTAWLPATVTNATRNTVQTNQNNNTANFSETKTATATNTTIKGIDFRYSNVAWPTADYHVLTVNYYDDYNFPNAPVMETSVANGDQLVYYNNTTQKPKGLATATWTRVPDASTDYKNEQTYTFYDEKARPVRSYTKNFLGGYTYTDSKLDNFSGQLQYSITKHKRSPLASDLEIMTKDAYTYSDQDRLKTQTHQINGGTIEVIANNSYDELGQLISKRVGNTILAPTQKVDYTYNIRGWMTGINDLTALSKTGEPKDLFAFKINYNNTPGITGGKALYNGNIAETFWISTSETTPVIRGYAYLYDNLNRLRTSFYKRDATVSNAYSENLTYDKNGNIGSLTRNGNSETATQIDALVYTYTNSNTTNQLLKVVDSAPAATKIYGFIDSTANTDDYTYDANGNMTKDNNKNITAITYSHLNLPTKITFATAGNIAYLYNATGQKVQKIVMEGTKETITDYLEGYQYLKEPFLAPALKFFSTVEGYVEVSGSSYKYVYQYKDHLGNIRLSYDKNLAIQDENQYYPFGLLQKRPTDAIVASNYKYKYNGKELQDELGLNEYAYGWRDYDPAIGRWNVIDQLAEKYITTSPYAFVQNNPLINREIDGREFDKKNDKKAKKLEKSIDKKISQLNKEIAKLQKRGEKIGDRNDRISELTSSKSDISDMRNKQGTNYVFGKAGGKNDGNSIADTYNTTGGNGTVTMFTGSNIALTLHEVRHGGQDARGEYNIQSGSGYGVQDEVSAYRAQYAFDGNFSYNSHNFNQTLGNGNRLFLDAGIVPPSALRTINNINNINSNMINDIGVFSKGNYNSVLPLYPPENITSQSFNSN